MAEYGDIRLVNSLKGVSSRRMRQEFRELARHYYRRTGCGRAPTSPDR
jgi:REP element-mobilizing transposase RayT